MIRTRRAPLVAATTAATLLLVAACGRSATNVTHKSNIDPTKGLASTTPAGTKSVSSVTWAVYRDVNSLDPIYAFDYPENTAITLMCESLLAQSPTGVVGPGVATVSTPSPTEMVFTLKPGVKFWDGHPVTPADVVYSLDRNTNSSLGGFYAAPFSRVKSIAATGSDSVTITLKQADYWLEGELASMPGIVIEKNVAEREGKNYGTPSGSIMCTGAYKYKSFSPGVGVTAVANTDYWNTAVHPLVQKILIKGVPDTSSLTSGLETGAIDGDFAFALATLDQLQANKNVSVTQGSGWSTDAFIVSNAKGVLGNVKVRQALSLALDRQGLVDSVFKGAALLPKWISNPGTFGYGKAVFDAAYAKAPYLAHNLTKAKQLVQEAGATGKSFAIGTSSQLADVAAEAGAYQAAAKAIGMKATLHSVSANDYINFFIDAKARAKVDGFLTTNYGDYADPAALLATLVLPDGSQNYDGYANPQVTSLMNQARSTADPDQRAKLIAQVEQICADQLPWIPDAQPTNLLVTNKNLTGATASFAYMFAPWANTLGGKG